MTWRTSCSPFALICTETLATSRTGALDASRCAPVRSHAGSNGCVHEHARAVDDHNEVNHKREHACSALLYCTCWMAALTVCGAACHVSTPCICGSCPGQGSLGTCPRTLQAHAACAQWVSMVVDEQAVVLHEMWHVSGAQPPVTKSKFCTITSVIVVASLFLCHVATAASQVPSSNVTAVFTSQSVIAVKRVQEHSPPLPSSPKAHSHLHRLSEAVAELHLAGQVRPRLANEVEFLSRDQARVWAVSAGAERGRRARRVPSGEPWPL